MEYPKSKISASRGLFGTVGHFEKTEVVKIRIKCIPTSLYMCPMQIRPYSRTFQNHKFGILAKRLAG